MSQTWKALANIERHINSGIWIIGDILYNIKGYVLDLWKTLHANSKVLQAFHKVYDPLISDALIIADEYWASVFTFNKGEKTLETEKYANFIIEYKIAHQDTTADLNHINPEIDLNPWDIFAEIHIQTELPQWSSRSEIVQQIIDLIRSKTFQTKKQGTKKVKYIMGISDLAQYMERFGFEYSPLDDYISKDNRLYHLKNSFLIKKIERLSYALGNIIKDKPVKNPMKSLSAKNRQNRKIGLCYYKL